MKTNFNGILTLLLALLVQIAFAQEKTVTGKVSDASGPLPGVTVIIKGTKTGTQTDFDGIFSIKAATGAVLQFSFIGMKTSEKTVGASNVIDVVMQESAESLEEIVIMGYGSKKKNELTGSTVQIKSEDIAEIPVASIDQALQGKVAGLTISGTSGTPGAIQDIRIRGISSITSSNSPLYVIDGVPIINENVSGSVDSNGDPVGSTFSSLASFNSNDIESMTVLKDASATSAYGARGANGVIVITTKSGKSGETKFDFSSSLGFSNDAIRGRDVLTAAQTTELGYEARVNEGWYSTVEEARADYNWTQDYWGVDGDTVENPNWTDVIKNKDAVQHQYNLSATGGSESSRFFASLGYFSSEATVLGSNFEKLSGSFSFNKDLNEKLKFSTKINASNVIQDGLLEASAYFSSPRAAKYFMNPLAGNPYNEDGSINRDLWSNVKNPLWIMSNDIHRNSLTRIISNSNLEWDVIENLKFKTNFSADYIVRDYKEYQNRIYGDGEDTGGSGYQQNYQNLNWVWQNSIDYRWNIAEDHRVDFKVLMEYQKNKSRYLSAEGQEFGTDGLTNLDIAGKPIGANASLFDWKSVSYLGMANYGFSNKFFVDLTLRREGSSRFTPDNRYGTFWAAGAAWNIHEENFFSNLNNVVNNFKIRASYGTNGNANIDLNKYQRLIGYTANYGGVGVGYPVQLGNKDLSWEKNDMLDVGFDLGLWKDKVTATFSYFNRKTYDLLLDVPQSRTSGHNSQLQNAGTMRNKGIEIQLNYNVVSSDDFNFSIGGNLATVDNEVIELAFDDAGDVIEITNYAQKVSIGQPVYAWYMRKYAGVNPDNGNAQWYLNGIDGELTENYNSAERGFVGGSALPTLTGGINTHLDFKGFFLDANLYFATGHKIFEEWSQYTHQGGLYNFGLFQGVADLMNRWQQPGDITNVPKVRWDWDRTRAFTSSRFLYDGDYARLKDVTFGYNFNSKILERTFFTDAKIYIKGTNLATWVKDDNLKQDPEIAANGFIGLTTPPSKTFSLGINLKF